MKTQAQTLTDRINGFDFYYQFSDDSRKFDKGSYEEAQIKAELDKLTPDQHAQLRSEITVKDECLNFHFREYFGNVTTPATEVPAEHKSDNEEGTTERKPVSFRSKVFTNAWTMYREGLFETFSEALRASWLRYRLVKALRGGLARFSFIKADGSMRIAVGTLDHIHIRYDFKGQEKTDKPHVVTYWDIEKKGWRACRVDRLQTVKAGLNIAA